MNYTNPVIVIRKSCLTGKIVWMYRGISKASAVKMYHCACKLEMERVRHWAETVAERSNRITHILNACLNSIPCTDQLTPEQYKAAQQLMALSRECVCDREFYNHIIEERRRRKKV